jgi:hypothetical protein
VNGCNGIAELVKSGFNPYHSILYNPPGSDKYSNIKIVVWIVEISTSFKLHALLTSTMDMSPPSTF